MSRLDVGELLASLTDYAPARVESDRRKPGESRIRAVALALLVVAASLAGVAGSAAAASTDGMVGVPDSNISADLPADADVGLAVEDLEGATETSSHAETTEVVVTTPERARDYVDANTVGAGGGRLALVIQDAENHDGRRVSLPADALRAALGYLPETVHGVHDSGDEWTRPVEAGGGRLAFRVPAFSSNSVTFSGELSLSGNPATDGASYQYHLQELDAVDDGPTVNLTGVESTESESLSRSGGDGDGFTVDVAGNLPPTSESVTLTGQSTSSAASTSATHLDGQTKSVSVGGNVAPSASLSIDSVSRDSNSKYAGTQFCPCSADTKWSGYYSAAPPTIGSLEFTPTFQKNGNWVDIDAYLHPGDVSTSTAINQGTKIASNKRVTDGEPTSIDAGGFADTSSGVTVAFYMTDAYARGAYFDTPLSLNGPEPSGITVSSGVDSASGLANGESATLDLSTGANTLTTNIGTGTTGSVSWSLEWTETTKTENPSVTIGGQTVSHAGHLNEGETITESVDLSTGPQTATISTAGGSSVAVSTDWTERAETENVVVTLNGQSETYPFTLPAGETTTLNLNRSWVESGTNRLTVEVGDELSSDAPTPAVGFQYAHGAVDDVSVDYSGEQWSERYNLSRSWGDATENATLTVPFSDSVAAVREVRKRVNGGTWTELGASEFDLDGTTLTARLGDLPSNATTDLRVVGSKVRTQNGEISVVEPTVDGNSLSTRFEVESVSGELSLEVSGTTPRQDWLHYISNSTHADPAATAVITEGGDAQTLTLPNAQVGTRATARTLPLEVEPQNDVRVGVEEPGSTPVLDVSPASVPGDSVSFGWFDTVSGSSYRLVSVTADGTVRASSTTSDGSAWLEVDDDGSRTENGVETLRLEVDSDSTASSSGDGPSRAVALVEDAASVAPSVHPVVILGAGAAVLLGGAFVVRRTRLRVWTVYPIVGLVGVVALESLRPGSVTGTVQSIALQIGSSASTVGPALALGGGGLVLWALYRAVKKWTSRPRIVLNRK